MGSPKTARTKKKTRDRERTETSRVVIISGLSGSGKTVALRALEDSRFFCVDNLPASLIDSLVTKISEDRGRRDIAVGIDIREKTFLSDFHPVIKLLRRKHPTEIVFLEADPETLIRRFRETRRPHPLEGDLSEAIHAERGSLTAIREQADLIIDTSSLSPHELRRRISSRFSLLERTQEGIAITLISFGFKYGVPQAIDLLFDARFLPNPFFVPALKNLTGRDRKVSEFVLGNGDAKEYIRKIMSLLDFVIPLYKREGRPYLSIAVGCTGGNHRSPAIIEALGKHLRKNNPGIMLTHRELS